MDIAPLLAPLSAEIAGGIDLSFSSDIDALQELRREDDPTLDQGVWVTELKSADWPQVARTCEAILMNTSKDLRVTGWLTDAWARMRGFEGLADGLSLAAGLVDTAWDQLYPRPEDGDQEQRIGNLRWLATRVDQLVPTLPLVTHKNYQYTLADIAGARSKRLADSAHPNGKSKNDPHAPPTDPELTLDIVWRVIGASGREGARTRRAHVARASAALERLQASTEVRLPEDTPSFVAPRDALEQALDELIRLERECGFNLPEAGQALPEYPGVVIDASAMPKPLPVPGCIETRAQALEQLRRVAAFFRSTEPHSPVAYLADKAANWSEMPLHEWLRVVVKDGGSLAHLEEMLGVEKVAAR